MILRDEKHRRLQQYSLQASITVESAFIMPVVLACIMLVLVINGYMHDFVFLNSFAFELLYQENGEIPDYEGMQDEVQQSGVKQNEMLNTDSGLFFLNHVNLYREQRIFGQCVNWNVQFDLPAKQLLALILKDPCLELSGGAEKTDQSMVQIIRYGG